MHFKYEFILLCRCNCIEHLKLSAKWSGLTLIVSVSNFYFPLFTTTTTMTTTTTTTPTTTNNNNIPSIAKVTHLLFIIFYWTKQTTVVYDILRLTMFYGVRVWLILNFDLRRIGRCKAIELPSRPPELTTPGLYLRGVLEDHIYRLKPKNNSWIEIGNFW